MKTNQVLLGLALIAFVAACDGPGVVGPGSQIPVVIGRDSTASTSVVTGTWNRTLLFVDEFGFSNSNGTTWQFGPDGTAVRTILTQNLSLGLSDQVVTTGRWQIQGTRIIIDFDPPASGHLELEFRFDAGQLILAGQSFSRVG